MKFRPSLEGPSLASLIEQLQALPHTHQATIKKLYFLTHNFVYH